MRPSERFLKAVEGRLLCAPEIRPALLDEIRGHLEDSIGALWAEDTSREIAEIQAIRDLGSPFRLALRLSIANGWLLGLAAVALRHLWAATLGLVVVTSGLAVLWILGQEDGALQSAPYHTAAICAALLVFGFALGRVVRGWWWSFLLPLGFLVVCHFESEYLDWAEFLAVVMPFVGAVLGSRAPSPHLGWLAWVAGLIPVGAFLGFGEYARFMLYRYPAAIIGWTFILLPWLLWFWSWLLWDSYRRRVAKAADAPVVELPHSEEVTPS